MGADLIGVGFTVRMDRECNLDAIDRVIDAISNEKLGDTAFLNAIDPGENFTYDLDPDDPDSLRVIRDALKEGARELDAAVSGHRHTQTFWMPGAPLMFVWAGGDSWGDDPFDGWSALALFVEYADNSPEAAEASGFVAGGLPSATQVAQLATDEGE